MVEIAVGISGHWEFPEYNIYRPKTSQDDLALDFNSLYGHDQSDSGHY